MLEVVQDDEEPVEYTEINHRWQLPGNYHVFIRVMLFYLFCWISMRILVNADFCHILYKYIYIYTLTNDIYIGEPSGY